MPPRSTVSPRTAGCLIPSLVRDFAGLGAAALLVLGPADLAAADPAEYLPTTHWAYTDLQALWSRGAVDSLDQLARPWSRVAIARALKEGLDRDPGLAGDPVFERLAWQFSRELRWLGESDAPDETAPLLALRGEREEARVQVGIDGVAVGSPPSKMQVLPGSGAFFLVKAYFRPNLYVGTEIRAEKTGSDRPLGDSLIKGEDLYLNAREAYVSFAPRNLEIAFGLTETRWGPGRRGSLLLGDAAAPYLTLRAAATIAGRVGFHAVHGSLLQSDNRYFAAHRLSFHVTPSLTIGVSEAARYDAPSPEWLYVLNLIPYTIVERYIVQHRDEPSPVNSRNNVMIALDGVWRIRPGLRLWGEALADELSTETSSIPHRLAGQVGAAVHTEVDGRPLEVAFEFTKVFRYTYSVFYDRNYILADDPLGWVEGPDTEHWGLGAKLDVSRDWWGTLDLDVVRRGEGFLGEYWDPAEPASAWSGWDLSGTVETTVRAFAAASWVPRDNVRAELGLGMRHVRNAAHEPGTDETDPEALFRIYLRK